MVEHSQKILASAEKATTSNATALGHLNQEGSYENK